MERYIQALLQEMGAWTKRLRGKYQITTVFIGGGTPTVLSQELLAELGAGLQMLFYETDSKPTEFTIEANPGTIHKAHIEIMKQMGINRVSLGLQSAQNEELLALGRIHTFEEFVASYKLLRDNGFDNINIDIMADIPKQTLKSYQNTLEQVLSLEPEHISSYSLIIEEGTAFFQMEEEGLLLIPDEETDRKMYELTQELLGQWGYTRYEISNYAKAGKECKHNLTYWKLGEYLGMGLGASSYFEGNRFSNLRNLENYIKYFTASVKEKPFFVEKEAFFTEQKSDSHINMTEEKYVYNEVFGMAEERYVYEENFGMLLESCQRLSKKEEMEEFVFLGLRMMKGISTQEYFFRFGVDFFELYKEILPKLFQKKLLAKDGNHDRIYLTKQGIDVSNMVLAQFLLEDEISDF